MPDVASAEFRVALRPASPLPPDGGAKPPPHPLVKASERGRCFAEAEVAVPSVDVDGEVFDPPFEAHAPCATCQFTKRAWSMIAAATVQQSAMTHEGLDNWNGQAG